MIRIAFSKGRDVRSAAAKAYNLLKDASERKSLWLRCSAKYICECGDRIDGVETTLFYCVFMRGREIPALVAKGNYDMGICGSDWVMESGEQEKLFMGEPLPPYVDVVLFCGKDDPVRSPAKVLTSGEFVLSEYPRITQTEFEALHGCTPELVSCSGSAESHIPHDYRFGVCVRETGKTLEESHQRVICSLYTSGITLIANLGCYGSSDECRLAYDSLYKAMKQNGAFTKRSR